MSDLMSASVLLSPAQRYHEWREHLRADSAQAVTLIDHLHGTTANLRQLIIEGRVHLDGDSAKRLAEVDGLAYAALILCRMARGLSEQLPPEAL